MAKVKKELRTLPATPEAAKADYDALLGEEPGEFLFSKEAILELAEAAIANRESFSYDPNADAMYRHYRDLYTRQGKQAMEDTIGVASSLTGGYGNSYALTAGQQAYGRQLEGLREVLPELYRLAYEKYDGQTRALQERYDSLTREKEAEYSAYLDGYDRFTDRKRELYDLYRDALQQQDDRYDRLYKLILDSGYEPTSQETAQAGMHQLIVMALREAWRQEQLRKEAG